MSMLLRGADQLEGPPRARTHPPARRLVSGARLRRHRSADRQANYLTESTTDEAEAQKILTRFLAQVDEQRNPRTKATLGAALEAWLRTHEAEETTLDGYRGYVRRTIEPALGDVPMARSRRRCWRSSMPICGAAGTSAATVSPLSTTAPPRSTSAGLSGTSAGPAVRAASRTTARRPAA